MQDEDYQRLVEKLRRIEAIFADKAATPGEKNAAIEASERIRQRLNQSSELAPPVEYSFNLSNAWSKKLLVALFRRYNIKPYRYARQRHTTVMARVPKRFLDETLWPEFNELNSTLQQYMEEITTRVISECVNKDASDVEIRPGQALLWPNSSSEPG